MEIYFGENSSVSDELLDTMKRAAEIAVRNEGLDPDICEISVTFVSEEEIRQLNRDYRGVDRVTDVLSFPQADSREELEDTAEMTGVMELGDVVICAKRARQQAKEFGHSFERELIYLFVHSVHHLMGYDHMIEEEKREMRMKEEAVMNELGIPRRTDRPEDEDAAGPSVGESAGPGTPAPAAPAEESTAETVPESEAESARGADAAAEAEGAAAAPRPAAETLPYQRALFRRAQEAMENAYAPYSGFRVGAALMAEDGSIWTGVNVENASYGASICAERTACVKAVSEGRTSFRSIAVAASSGRAQMCGICRQFLAEFSPEMEVITGTDDEHLEITKLNALLPDSFRL